MLAIAAVSESCECRTCFAIVREIVIASKLRLTHLRLRTNAVALALRADLSWDIFHRLLFPDR